MFDLISLVGGWSLVVAGAVILALSTSVFIAARVVGVWTNGDFVAGVIRVVRILSSAGIAVGVLLVSVSLAQMALVLLAQSLWWSLLFIALLPMLLIAFVTLFFDNCFDSKKETVREVFLEMVIWTPAAIISLLVIGAVVAVISLLAIALASDLVSMPIATNGQELTVVLSVIAAIVLLVLPCFILLQE